MIMGRSDWGVSKKILGTVFLVLGRENKILRSGGGEEEDTIKNSWPFWRTNS